MFMLTVSDPTLKAALIQGQRARSEAMARGFYLALRVPGRLFAAVAETVEVAASWFRRRNRDHQVIATLRGLNDHMLSDIGIGRSEILAAVRNGERHLEDYRTIPPVRRRTGPGPVRQKGGSAWKKAA